MERVNNIKPTTPYMLRQDGALFACGTVHPYIKMYYSADFEKNWNELMNVNPQFLDWFYEHTLNEETKNLIENIRSNKDEELFNKLNNATNQEFCRVRTSNFKYKYGGDNGQLYFRISSKGFNWYDAIWKVISDNIDWIQYVTVMRDYQTFGKQFDYLKLKGEPINEMPIDDFLTASGNPVLEKLENLNEGEDMNKVDRIDNFINELYELRQQSIAKDGEYGVGNLVFKEMRSKGYLDNLKDMKTDLENKEMSLEGLNEDTVKQNGKWVNKGDEGTHGKFDTKKEADAQRKAMFANGYHESLNEAEDEEPSLEDTLEQCFIEKGCNYERQANGIFKFNDEESFDKAYDSVQVLAGQSQVDIDGMRLKVQGEQTQPDVASGSAPTSDYGAYLPDEDAEVDESLNEVAGWQVAKWQKAQGEKRAQKAASYTDADKTEKTKSFTPAQLDAIKLTSLSADEQEKLKNSKMTKVQFDKLSGWIKSLKARQFGADYKSNVRADLYEIDKLCKDILNESLEESLTKDLHDRIVNQATAIANQVIKYDPSQENIAKQKKLYKEITFKSNKLNAREAWSLWLETFNKILGDTGTSYAARNASNRKRKIATTYLNVAGLSQEEKAEATKWLAEHTTEIMFGIPVVGANDNIADKLVSEGVDPVKAEKEADKIESKFENIQKELLKGDLKNMIRGKNYKLRSTEASSAPASSYMRFWNPSGLIRFNTEVGNAPQAVIKLIEAGQEQSRMHNDNDLKSIDEVKADKHVSNYYFLRSVLKLFDNDADFVGNVEVDESLEEANQDPLQSSIYKKEANKQKKNPDHYMPRGGLNKGLGDPAQSIKAFNHMMGADNFSGGASMADGTVGAVSVGGGMGEAMDPNAKKTQIDENEIKDFLKNSREGQDPIDITDQIVDIFGYDDKLFDEILDFVSHQMFNGKEEKSDLDRVLDNNTTGKWEDDNGQFVIDATRLNKEDLVIIYYKDKEEKVYQVKIHNYMGKTDTVKDAAKTIDIASLVHEHAGELIEPDDVVSNTIEWSEDGDDDIEVTIFLVND